MNEICWVVFFVKDREPTYLKVYFRPPTTEATKISPGTTSDHVMIMLYGYNLALIKFRAIFNLKTTL